MASNDHRGIHGGYSSELEPDSDVERRRRKRHDLAGSAPSYAAPASSDGSARFASASAVPPSRRLAADLVDKEEAHLRRNQFLQMDAYDRHKMLVNNYLAYYGGKLSDFAPKNKVMKTDADVIKEHNRFLWDDDDVESGEAALSWEQQLAKRYYDKLFKEYCIADLSRFQENKIAMRWRTEQEVVSGKGQFKCGERKCRESAGLASWEVNFGYEERGQKKNALVKLRLCPDCSNKLNFHKKRNLAVPPSLLKKKDEEAATNVKQESVEKAEEAAAGQEIWQKPLERKTNEEERTIEEEMDSYLADLFQ